MNLPRLLPLALLTAAITLFAAGCSNETEMTQDDIQYISHVDQARFFQRQGELKASTIEARSAIQLQPDRVEPYFIIINNLLTAGDAVNAERQLDQLLEKIPEQGLTQSQRNEAALIRAEAQILQGNIQQAREALDQVVSPVQETAEKRGILLGRAWLVAGNFERAEAAYRDVLEINNGNIEALVGLARAAMAAGNAELAKERLAVAEEKAPQHEEVQLLKGQIAHLEGNWAVAEQAYIEALETIGQYDVMTFRKYETISALVTALREQGKSAEAFVYEEILAKSGPGTIKSNMEAASQALEQNDLDTAARYLEETLNQVPGHRPSALMLGVIRFRQGRAAEAEELLEPLADLEDSGEIRKLLAATRISMRDPLGARDLLKDLDNRDNDPQTLALVGIATLAGGDDQSGRQLIEKSLEINPDNHNLRLRYASYLFQAGDLQEAINQARKIPTDAAERSQAVLLIANAQNRAGDVNGALITLDAALMEDAENVRALVLKGNLLAQSSRYDAAETALKKARGLAPGSPAPMVGLGNLQRLRGNTTEAITLFKQAVKADPNDRMALQSLAGAIPREELTGFMAELNQENPEAIGPRLILLETALIQDDAARVDELTAQLMERTDERTPSPTEPYVAAVYEGIATQMAQRGRGERALEILNRGRVLFPENEQIALKYAAIEFQNGNTSKARTALADVKQHHPNSPLPYEVEASHYERQGEFRQAAELYELALSKRATPELYLALSRALGNAGQTREASEVLERAASDFPNNPAITLNLAILYQQLEQNDAAVAAYESLLETHPENGVALNNLAWLYHQIGDSRSLDIARRAYESSPENGAIADTYGWILFQSGKKAEGIKLLEKAHKLAPESSEIAMHLVEAYRTEGRDNDAQRILKGLEQGNNS